MISQCVEKLKIAKDAKSAITPLSEEFKSLTLKDGYLIQQGGLDRDLKKGEKLCGYKMGLTSLAKQRDVNVHSPIRGYLLSSMEVKLGEAVDTAPRIHPRVEPEVALRFKSRVAGKVTVEAIKAALDFAVAAVEILDSRFQAFSFKLPDVVADNTSASGFILGKVNLLDLKDPIPLLGVVVKKNGEVLETGCPAAVLGNPFLSAVALAESLAEEGKAIEAGMIVLTGGITASITVQKGDNIQIEWPQETITIPVK